MSELKNPSKSFVQSTNKDYRIPENEYMTSNSFSAMNIISEEFIQPHPALHFFSLYLSELIFNYTINMYFPQTKQKRKEGEEGHKIPPCSLSTPRN